MIYHDTISTVAYYHLYYYFLTLNMITFEMEYIYFLNPLFKYLAYSTLKYLQNCSSFEHSSKDVYTVICKRFVIRTLESALSI